MEMSSRPVPPMILNPVTILQDSSHHGVGRAGSAGPLLQDVQGLHDPAGVLSLILLIHPQGVRHHQGHVTSRHRHSACSKPLKQVRILDTTPLKEVWKFRQWNVSCSKVNRCG